MKTEPVLKLMSSLDPGLIEEADLPLPVRRRPRLTRMGLIAACLCLALIGTAAAGVVVGWVRATDPSVTELPHRDGGTVTITSFEVAKDGSVYIPLENISQQARDYASSFLSLPQYKNFDSWAEAEEFLGVHLAGNPVLEQAKLWTQPADPEVSEDDPDYQLPGVGARARANKEARSCAVGFHGRADSPDRIELYSVYELEDRDGNPFNLGVIANIYTAALGERVIQYQYVNQAAATENYVTPSGLQTAIITTYGIESGYTYYNVQFSLHGADYIMSAFYLEGGDAGSAVLPVIKEVLDAYQ